MSTWPRSFLACTQLLWMVLLLVACSDPQGPPPVQVPNVPNVPDDPAEWAAVDGYTSAAAAVVGALVLGPEGMELAPGQTARLSATLHPSGTATITSWVSSSPEVLAVDASGTISARAEGVAEILVTDASMRVGAVTILVTSSPAAGVTGIVFGAPVVSLTSDERAMLTYVLKDARGSTVQGPTPVFEVEHPGIVVVDANGQLAGTAAGFTRIFARLPGATSRLAGAQLVTVGSSAAQPDGTLVVNGCSHMATPYAFGRPGLSGPVRVVVSRTRWRGTRGTLEVTQEAPTSVRVAVTGVVTGGAGALTSVAPGITRVATFVDGELCDSSIAFVYPDLTGDWTATCTNGDQGQMALRVVYPGRSFVSVARKVTTQDGTGARTEALFLDLRGEGCFEKAATPSQARSECSGPITGKLFLSTRPLETGRVNGGLCTSGSPCAGPGLQVCASGIQTGPALLSSNDAFSLGACSYARGTGALSCRTAVGEGEVCLDETTGFTAECVEGLTCLKRLPPDCAPSSIGTCRPRVYQMGESYCCRGIGSATADCAPGLQHMPPTPGDCTWSPLEDACMCAPPAAPGEPCCQSRDCAGACSEWLNEMRLDRMRCY